MLEIKVYRDEENIVVVDGNTEGRSTDICVELCTVFESVLCTIAKNEKQPLAEKLELTTVATVITDFIVRKTGKTDDKEFIDGMSLAATKFLQGNILMNTPEGKEKVCELLEKLVADNEQEQPEGEPDGEK